MKPSVKRTAPTRYEQLVVDDAMLAYVEWREECARVWECHDRWRSPGPEGDTHAYAAYEAALDREAAAARAYASRVKRVADHLHNRREKP